MVFLTTSSVSGYLLCFGDRRVSFFRKVGRILELVDWNRIGICKQLQERSKLTYLLAYVGRGGSKSADLPPGFLVSSSHGLSQSMSLRFPRQYR